MIKQDVTPVVNSPVFVILIHRIGMVILLLGSSLLVILPYVFTKEDDMRFATKSAMNLYRVSWIGLLLLIVTGSIQLTYGIPTLFPLKALLIIITLILFIKPVSYQPQPKLRESQYLKYSYARLSAVLVTGIIGLIL